MVRIEDLELHGYEFRCKVSALDLREDQLIELGLDIGSYSDMQEELTAGGDLIVSFYHDEPYVHVENFAIVNTGTFVDLDGTQVDFKALARQLEDMDDGTWAQDKAEAAADEIFGNEW